MSRWGTVFQRLISSTGVPQGTVVATFLFTLSTAYFNYNSGSCHIQKYSDDTAIVACFKNGREEEYRSLIENFYRWSQENCLTLNTSKTNKMVFDIHFLISFLCCSILGVSLRKRGIIYILYTVGISVEQQTHNRTDAILNNIDHRPSAFEQQRPASGHLRSRWNAKRTS